jgi:hypothetical protein
MTAATLKMDIQGQLRIALSLFSRARRLLFQELIRSFRLNLCAFLATKHPLSFWMVDS